MLAREAPRGLAVPGEIDNWKCVIHEIVSGAKVGCANRNRFDLSAGAQVVGMFGSMCNTLRYSAGENITR
jgi:hypothetical protein